MANLMPKPKSGRLCKFNDMQRAKWQLLLLLLYHEKCMKFISKREETCFMGSLYFQ
ncbi:hypothetical protein L873DRAFT_1817223 [Choiromyces venosus 120613-1]|uniref:Uncharacterized protein n=1 Tax=Choiromyces venosus 120613-1 TaxID=1336337 RepID=A0A3N4J8C9_9PEZI|nr:hypothetical protein L873DRAFT_1817223 [Choiromyces venosus 120613-1]